MKTQKEIRLKPELNGGKPLPRGLPVTFLKDKPTACLVHGDRPEPFRVKVANAFKQPSMEQLEEWSNDGICESIAGNCVEPDGWDSEGTPSWLLALGMI
jgi:hypothetical protein